MRNGFSKNEEGFLNEVAAELVSRGIDEPTADQIADAMQFRLDRQSEIFRSLYPEGWSSTRRERATEFRAQVSESVYKEIRNA